MTLCRLCGAPIAQCRPDSLHTGVAPELQSTVDMNATEYEATLDAFRAVSKKYRAATLAYRAREIGDAEFIAARRALDAALAVNEEAEHAFLASEGKS